MPIVSIKLNVDATAYLVILILMRKLNVMVVCVVTFVLQIAVVHHVQIQQ